MIKLLTLTLTLMYRSKVKIDSRFWKLTCELWGSKMLCICLNWIFLIENYHFQYFSTQKLVVHIYTFFLNQPIMFHQNLLYINNVHVNIFQCKNFQLESSIPRYCFDIIFIFHTALAPSKGQLLAPSLALMTSGIGRFAHRLKSAPYFKNTFNHKIQGHLYVTVIVWEICEVKFFQFSTKSDLWPWKIGQGHSK